MKIKMVLNETYLLIGGNQGDRLKELNTACTMIEEKIGEISIKSTIYQTAAWGKRNQPDFLNQVLKVNSKLSPKDVLKKIGNIEEKMGRVRKEKWAERNIDIDILYFNEEIIVCEDLKVPHPEIQNRRFTLIPLSEVAPDYMHPVLNLTNKKLLENCPDSSEVKPLKKPSLKK